MHPRGVVLSVTRTTEKIDAFVQEQYKAGKSFTAQEVNKTTGVNRGTAQQILHQKTKAGLLKKLAYGIYQGTGQRLALQSAQALIAETLWDILQNAKTPITSSEATIQVELRLNRPPYSASSPVNSLLSKWYNHHGALDRFGERRSYEYKIKDGITERPVATPTRLLAV